MITQKQLKDLLHYNPDTGIFIWMKRPSKKIMVGEIAGAKSDRGRMNLSIAKTKYKLHRLAWLYMTGSYPDGEIDHIDQDASNNRFSNLRDVSHQENSRNMRLHRDNTSGVSGACWNKEKRGWDVEIGAKENRTRGGRFKNFDEAVAKRKSLEIEFRYHANHGRKS